MECHGLPPATFFPRANILHFLLAFHHKAWVCSENDVFDREGLFGVDSSLKGRVTTMNIGKATGLHVFSMFMDSCLLVAVLQRIANMLLPQTTTTSI